MRSTASSLAALVMLTVIAVALEPVEAATTRALVIQGSTAQPVVAFKAFDAHPPKVYDFNGDGRMEIIDNNDNKWTYVFDSKTGKLLFEVKTRYPTNWGARTINGPEAAVLVAGQAPRLIVANSAAYVTSFRFDGVNAGGTFDFTKEWEKRLNFCYSSPGMDSRVELADLDNDGDLEIIGQTEQVGVYALRADGSELWHKCIGGGNGDPSSGDVNGDGKKDVVFCSDGGVCTAANGATGSTRWKFWVGDPKFNIGNGAMPVGPAVGNIDGVGGDDVVVGAKDKHQCEDFTQNHSPLFAIRGNGSLLWMRQQSFSTPLTYTHVAIVDRDVYWADWNTQGHKCGDANYPVVGKSHVYKYDSAGNLDWWTTTAAFWSNDDIAVADADGDGNQEILATCTNSNGHEGICYLNSATGARETFVDVYPWKVTRGPIIEDLWGEGTGQLVVPVAPYGSGSSHGLHVYDTGVPFRAAWPHLDYPTAGPSGGSPPPPPPPPGEEGFEATFELSENINNWWVEVWVESTHVVTDVEARVDGGAWVALSHKDWGAWAKSFHVDSGAQVVFRATDANGATATSQAFTWP